MEDKAPTVLYLPDLHLVLRHLPVVRMVVFLHTAVQMVEAVQTALFPPDHRLDLQQLQDHVHMEGFHHTVVPTVDKDQTASFQPDQVPHQQHLPDVPAVVFLHIVALMVVAARTV